MTSVLHNDITLLQCFQFGFFFLKKFSKGHKNNFSDLQYNAFLYKESCILFCNIFFFKFQVYTGVHFRLPEEKKQQKALYKRYGGKFIYIVGTALKEAVWQHEIVFQRNF